MSDHTDLNYKYLEEAIMNLDPNDPMTKEHSPGVLMGAFYKGLFDSVNTYIKEHLRALASFENQPLQRSVQEIEQKRLKMYPVVCAVCKNKFYPEEDFLGRKCSPNADVSEPLSGEQMTPPVRTSTPVPESETGSSGFADSVTDFFYQTWKSGLHSNDTIPSQRCLDCWDHPRREVRPVYYPQQLVFFNTVIYQTFPQYSYVQPVGYRPDGTFGVLLPMGTYWGYN